MGNNPQLLSNPQVLSLLQARGLIKSSGPEKRVRAASLDVLRPAVEKHPALKWHERLESVCGQIGSLLAEDDSDDTSQVSFSKQGIQVWLPSQVISNVTEEQEDQSAQ